jgi:hypothetical protein
MLKKLKRQFSQVVHDKPGERFINYYRRRKDTRKGHPLKRALYILPGVVLIAAGLFLGFLPGAPGIFLGIPGLALVAAQFRVAATMLDRSELVLRKILQKIRQRFGGRKQKN